MSDADAGVVERLRSLIGTTGEERVSVVEAGHVRRFCQAIGDDDPRWREEAPPTFVVALASGGLPLADVGRYGRGGLLNGGNRFEYFEPIRIGDTIRARTRLVDAYEKRGGSGGLLFMITETDFVNQEGRVAVRTRNTAIRR